MMLALLLLCSPVSCGDSFVTLPVPVAVESSIADSRDLSSANSDAKGEKTQSKARPELPRIALDFTYPVLRGRTIRVGAGDNLQWALNRARRGDEIVLAAAAQFTGNFTLPALKGTPADGWVVIRGEKSDRLPVPGTRVTPSDGALMPAIITTNTAPAIRFQAGASGWWLSGLEVTVSPALTHQQYGLIFAGESDQSTMESVPSDIVIERMYVHGQSTSNMSRCIALNSARTVIVDSHLGDCHGRGFDSQAIAGWAGPGPYRIENNHLEGAGENLLFGGADPLIQGLIPSDIVIRRNYIVTPLSWKGVWLKKNLFELKNAVRVLVEGNVMDGSWTHGQTGFAVVLKSGNQSGGCRWCRTTDVTFRRNLIRNSGAGFNVAARDDNPNTDTTARRILITENVLERIGIAPYEGEQRGFQLLRETADITIERSVLSGDLIAPLVLEGSPGTLRAVFRDNVWAEGRYGVVATDRAPGGPSIATGAPGTTWANITLIGPMQSGYPPGTQFRSAESGAPLASEIRRIVKQATQGVVLPR